MRLILTRHGETIENRKGIIQGQKYGTLSKKGIGEAKKLALRLKKEKIDAIYSSDLERTKNTTKEIVKYHPNAPIKYVKELRERDAGNLVGKSISSVYWKKVHNELETRKKMRKRSKKILDEAYKKHKKDTVLFVSHGGINMALISVIMNKPASYMDELKLHQNTSISIFEITENKDCKVHVLNCTEHLA